MKSRGFEADGSDEGIEIIDHALVEAIELRSPLGFELCIGFYGAQKACGERRVDAFEELQEDEADRVPVREELIAVITTESGLARSKYGSTNSSRRPFGASMIGISLGRSFLHPLLKFVSDAAQSVARHRVQLTIRIEEPDHSLRLLKRLNQSIYQNAVEAAIVPMYAVPVVLVEGVHDRPNAVPGPGS